MEKIIVTGANGQLGSELTVLSKKYPKYQWVFADRTQITLDNLELLDKQLKEFQPDIIFSCGAYTDVDKAESEMELAYKVNHLAVALIAKYRDRKSTRLNSSHSDRSRMPSSA